MVVRRNFERLYRSEEDPWQIGEATTERYRGYVLQIEREKPPGGFESALDLGCGKGAFTANLIRLARSVTGIELSEIAVAKARVSHPSLTFLQGDARRLARMALPAGGYDLVVSSDLIYYLTPREAETFLLEIKRLLAPAGRLFLAAWSPGGRYHTPESLEEILARHFALLRSETLPSRHAWFMARHRWQDLILSVDRKSVV